MAIKLMIKALLLGLLLSVPAVAQFYDAVALTLGDKGKPYATVDVDGMGAFPFLLDTGAENTVIFENLVEILRLPKYDNKSRTSYTGNSVKAVTAYYVGVLQLGKIRMPKGFAIALPTRANTYPKGILGGSLWQGVTAEFNLDEKQLKIYNKGQQFDPKIWSKLDGQSVTKRIFSVDIMVDGKAMRAVVDTGTNRSILNAAAAKLLALEAQGRIHGTSKVVGAANVSQSATRFTARSVTLAGVTLVSQELYVADLAIFHQLKLAEMPVMLLGMDVLQHFNFAVDLSNTRMFTAPRKMPYAVAK